jgi:hypothetical protein
MARRADAAGHVKLRHVAGRLERPQTPRSERRVEC